MKGMKSMKNMKFSKMAKNILQVVAWVFKQVFSPNLCVRRKMRTVG